jgi:hypothetical protein
MGIEIFRAWNVFCILNYFHKVFIFTIKSSKLSVDSGAICSSEPSTCVLTGILYACCTPEVDVFLFKCSSISFSSISEIPKKK